MESVNRITRKTKRPVKILQYGEGNFLRAFVCYMTDIANEAGIFDYGIEIVKPIEAGGLAPFHEQDCIYTVLLRGIQNGESREERRIVTCVQGAVDSYSEYEAYAAFAKESSLRFVVSNTTEAGIVYDPGDCINLKPPKTYPGKLTKFLYERFAAFNGAKDKGLIILTTELIEENGARLREACLKLAGVWNLPQQFINWLSAHNIFCNTLVDRIVTGYPKDSAQELEKDFGYTDKLLSAAEPFALWVIETDRADTVSVEFPLHNASLPVIFTDNLRPYRERKVRVLNGAHTACALAAYLMGIDTVFDMMKDETARAFLEKALYCEIVPMVPLPLNEVMEFADSVIERFENPFIKHSLLSISLNSVSKFKARILPTIIETQTQTGKLPSALCFSLAALMSFYSGCFYEEGHFCAKRGNETYYITDDGPVLEFFAKNRTLPAEAFTQSFLNRGDFWGTDLNEIPRLAETVSLFLRSIRDNGMKDAVRKLLK